MAIADVFDGVRELGRRARGSYDNANLWIGPELRESDDWHDFLQSAHTAIDALDQADKSVDALVQTVAADKPEVVVDLGDISRRLHELAENLKLIIEGTDEHYVYSLQVNRRLRAGGESMTAERIDIGEALANEWLPEVHTAIFASATMTVSKSFEHFNHAVGLDRIGASTSSSLHLDSSYDFDSNMAVVVAGDIPDPRDRERYLSALECVLSMPISHGWIGAHAFHQQARYGGPVCPCRAQIGASGPGAQLPATQLVPASPARSVYQRADLIALCA